MDLEKLKIDIELLAEDIEKAYNSNQGIDSQNQENIRMWKIYNEIREKVIELSSEKFSSLRQIELPPPNNTNQYLRNRYYKQELLPLLNEVKKLSKYYNSYLNGTKSSSINTNV